MVKKLMVSLLSAVMMLGMAALLPESVADKMGFEIEASAANSFSSAQSISVNRAYSTKLNSASDVKYYKFSVSNDGYISIDFGKNYDESGYRKGWNITLYNSNQNEIDWYEVYCGNSNTETSTTYGIKKGTYYIRVRESDNYSAVLYSLKVNYKADNNWDCNISDNGFSTARNISVNTKYYGTIHNDSDVDYYVFTTPSNGYINIKFGKDYDEAGYEKGWNISIYDSNKNIINGYDVYCGDSTYDISYNYGLAKGTYYIIVKKIDYNISKVTYSMSINHYSSSLWEKELNNDLNRINTISMGTTYTASIHNSDDIDYYKFDNAASATVPIIFGKDYDEAGYKKGWRITIYNSSMEEIKSFEVFCGDANAYTESVYIPKGTTYIKITKTDNLSQVNYKFQIGSKSISSCKISIPYSSYTYRGRGIKPTVTVKDGTKKLTKGTDYIVSYKNNTNVGKATITVTGINAYSGTLTKTFTVKALDLSSSYAKVSIPYSSYTYTGSAVKPKVTVKFKDGDVIPASQYTLAYSNNTKVGVATITVKAKGGNVTGSYKKTFVVKPAKNQIKSITSTKGAFKLTWNKGTAGTVGYQVQYSTDKSFSKNVHSWTTTSLSKTSENFSSVPKSGETWYVRVRSFYTKDGKASSTRYGNYSDVKTIKIK